LETRKEQPMSDAEEPTMRELSNAEIFLRRIDELTEQLAQAEERVADLEVALSLSDSNTQEAQERAEKAEGERDEAREVLADTGAEAEILRQCVTDAEADVKRLREAVAPFAHPDLQRLMSGCQYGDDSIVFQRCDAVLKIGDFRKAADALAASEGQEGGGA